MRSWKHSRVAEHSQNMHGVTNIPHHSYACPAPQRRYTRQTFPNHAQRAPATRMLTYSKTACCGEPGKQRINLRTAGGKLSPARTRPEAPSTGMAKQWSSTVQSSTTATDVLKGSTSRSRQFFGYIFLGLEQWVLPRMFVWARISSVFEAGRHPVFSWLSPDWPVSEK